MKEFTLKIHIKIHMKIHTGNKSFKCEICEQLFLQRQILKDIIQRFTPTDYLINGILVFH